MAEKKFKESEVRQSMADQIKWELVYYFSGKTDSNQEYSSTIYKSIQLKYISYTEVCKILDIKMKSFDQIVFEAKNINKSRGWNIA